MANYLNLTAKSRETHSGNNRLAKFSGIIKDTRTITTEPTTLLDYESGKYIFLAITGSDNVPITLPEPRAGLNFTFIVAASPASGEPIIRTATSNTLNAMGAADSAADGPTSLLCNAVTIETASIGGERIEFISDDTYWYCYASQQAVGSITFS